ncbi:MAG: hypothetical protein H6717_27090 [Polyangiaceae bacterium]|nr:hypothetical protein [Polyangiaceae bacterium]
MSPFDRSLSLRTVGLTVALVAVTTGVVVITDEAGSTTAMRVARLCAFTPALALIAAELVIVQARSRGELLALEALGVSPPRALLGAFAASFCLGIAATALVLSPVADASSLFPAVSRPASWVVQAGALVDVAHGITVSGDGSIALGVAQQVPEVAGVSGGVAAALCIGPLAALGPPWLAARLGRAGRALSGGLTLLAVIVLLHAVAAGVVPVWASMFGALPLLVAALYGHRKWRQV